jgi:hypothetical protein
MDKNNNKTHESIELDVSNSQNIEEDLENNR